MFIFNNIRSLYEEKIEYDIVSVLLTEGDSGYIDIDFDSSQELLNYIESIKKHSLFSRDIV